jgi:mono/diheme cytochrome c family protein
MRTFAQHLFLLIAAIAFGGFAYAADEADALGYNEHVRTILSNGCFACHGPDANARKADLRLDIREGAIADRDGVRAIVPGDIDASELVKRINHPDPDKRMPPSNSPRQISAADIATLTKWIEQGAEYEGHWAYIAPQRPAVPAVGNEAWPSNPVDHFLLRKLESKGIEPSAEADRITLIRRAYFDLIGLPPTSEEAQAALDDPNPDWFARMIDRLLASPHYGERMAVDWLDLVRYADSNGYHSDEERSMWPYRDYVIASFNDNTPYDDFTIEQLAGDLLPDARTEQQVASGYNRLNQITAEGGAQAEEYLAMYAADRVRTTSSVWLGSTVACAECHDHKYDPFTMRDFYAFAAFFADIDEPGVYAGRSRWEPVLALPTLEEQVRERNLRADLEAWNQAFNAPDESLAEGRGRWEAEQRAALANPDWLPVWPSDVKAEAGSTLTVLEDGSIMSSGDNPDEETYEIAFTTNRSNVTGVRIEIIPDASFEKGLARTSDLVVLIELQAALQESDGTPGAPIPFAAAEATAEEPDYDVKRAIDGDLTTGWVVSSPDRGKAERVTAAFGFEEPVEAGPGTPMVVRLVHGSAAVKKAAFGRFRVSLTTSGEVTLSDADAPPEPVVDTLFTAAEDRSPEAVAALNKYYRHVSPELRTLREKITAAEEELSALLSGYAITLVTKSVEPRTMRVLPRGDWMDDSGEIVDPATPSFLFGAEETSRRQTRLDLAEWLIDEDNPLTARVFVNRLWQRFFGTGLSRVLDDVGAQGEWPTHPELLDWLAVEFVESGWDVKHMVRLIATSSAYRQSSDSRPGLKETDPYNRLIARQSRKRLEAEFIRDNALSVSGLLVRDVGGRSVRPYQPAGYYAHMNFPKRTYQEDTGEHLYRRGVYTHWQRSFLHPALIAFDAPSREECTAQRPVSNTPQQALVLLNDPVFVETARAFAERIIREGGDSVNARIEWAIREALTREPQSRELRILKDLVHEHVVHFQAHPEQAAQAVSTGASPVPDDIAVDELAAWTSVARAILNLHETITRT